MIECLADAVYKKLMYLGIGPVWLVEGWATGGDGGVKNILRFAVSVCIEKA